jgi:hypothetical protein
MAVTRSKTSKNNVSLAHAMCDRRGQIFNYASGACVAKDTSRGKALLAAQTKAKAVLKSGKTIKEKLKTILKIGGGLSGATLAAYGAYLTTQPRFRTMMKAALAATRSKIDITGSTHRAIARASDTVKILVGKVAALVGAAGAVAANKTKKIYTGIRGIAQLVQSGASRGVSGAVKLVGGTISAGGSVARRTVNVVGTGAKYARNRAFNTVKYTRNRAGNLVKYTRNRAGNLVAAVRGKKA